MTPDQLALISEWNRAQGMLRQWEAYERSLRSQVVSSMFGDYGDGTKIVPIGNGFTLKNVNTTRWDIRDSLPMRQLVRQFAEYGPTAEVGTELVKDKPRLSLRAFKALPQWGRDMMTPHVTATPQLPQLSIEVPKG